MAVSGERFRPRTVDAPGGPIIVFESTDVDRDLEEAIADNAPTPYGRVLWSSAPCVAQVVSTWNLAGRTLLEVGCGTGLVSLVAARRGAHVTATDVDAGALAAVERAAQSQSLPVSTMLFNICGAHTLPAADIVVVADLLYEELLAAAVARRVAEARARGSAVVVGDPGRVFRSAFVRLLAESGHEARFSPVREGAHRADVMILGGP